MHIFAAIGSGITSAWNWFTGTPVGRLCGAAILALFAWEAVKRELEQSGERKERKKNDLNVAREQAKVAETRTEITQERTDDRQRADAAVEALPRFDGPEQLRKQRPGLYAILFGDAEAGSRPAEGR